MHPHDSFSLVKEWPVRVHKRRLIISFGSVADQPKGREISFLKFSAKWKLINWLGGLWTTFIMGNNEGIKSCVGSGAEFCHVLNCILANFPKEKFGLFGIKVGPIPPCEGEIWLSKARLMSRGSDFAIFCIFKKYTKRLFHPKNNNVLYFN